MSYAGLGHLAGAECGDMPDIGQEMGIEPRSRAASTGQRVVPTVWAQRALNAAGVRTAVDGIAGPGTLRSLVSAWTSMGRSGAQPVLVDAGHVAISPGFEARLSILRRVADPSGSTCGPCQWTSCSSGTRRTTTTTGTSTSTPSTSTPAATPDSSEPPSDLLVEMPSGDGGGLIARYGIWPWVIGGTALVGVGLWFLVGAGAGSVRANRRRVRRNMRQYGDNWPQGLTESARHAAELRRAEEEGFSGRSGTSGAYKRDYPFNDPYSFEEEPQGPKRRRRRSVRRNTQGYTEEYVVASISAAQTKWFKSKEKALDFARSLKRAGHDVSVEWRKMKWGEHTVASRAITVNRITPAQRARMPKSAFVFPSRRSWPVNNARRAYAAIQYLRMGRARSASDFNEIRNAVRRRFPDVWAIYGKNLTWDRSKAAKAKRRSTKARRRTSRGMPRRIAANWGR